MAASIAAVYPHMNHIGGDGFWLIREPSGRVRAIMGAAPPARKATPQLIATLATTKSQRAGRSPRSPCRARWRLDARARSRQGANGGTAAAACAVRSRHQACARGLHRNAEPGAAHASKNTPSSKPRRASCKLSRRRQSAGGGREAQAGRRSPRRSSSSPQAGLDDFYRGDVGREIAADLERIGSPVTRADLEKYRGEDRRAAQRPDRRRHALQYAAADARLASLMILALFDRLRVTRPRASTTSTASSKPPSAPSACAIASSPIRTRSTAISTASSGAEIPRRRGEKIDRNKAARWPAPNGAGDTVWMGAADASGLVVSYIQSLYWEFGSGCVLPATGILMQNRGVEFLARPQGAQRAGARPPAVSHAQSGARRRSKTAASSPTAPWAATASRKRKPPCSRATSRSASRSSRHSTRRAGCLGRTWGSTHTNLRLESRFDGNLIDRLMSAGHDVEVLGDAYSDTMGHAGAVVLHPNGTLEGGHDPRADGGAAGI